MNNQDYTLQHVAIANDDSKQTKWPPSLIDDIVRKIGNNKIVPLIGSGAYYIHESTGDITVQEYVVRELLKLEPISIELTDDNKKKFCCGYKGMTNVNKIFKNSPLTLYNSINNLFSSSDFKSKLRMYPRIKEFLEAGNFPLIITTCVFRDLEILIPKYNDTGIAYQMEGTTDQGISNNLANCPCVYYLFGTIDNDDAAAVITEKYFLKYLYCIQDSNNRPLNLKEYLSPKRGDSRSNKKSNEKYLLSIGCDMPDWTFRIIIYSLKEQNGDLKYQERKVDNFQGGMLVHNVDQQLDDFLADIGYYSAGDLDLLFEEINKKIPNKKKPTLFLSVNSEEYEDVINLKRELEKQFEVWFFKDNGKNRYWKSINEGLIKSQYFMPIVSSDTLLKMRETCPKEIGGPDVEIGIITEMRMALEKKAKSNENTYCIPVYYKITKERLFNALKEGHCPDLKPLFEGIQGITTPLNEISCEEIINYIKNS